jgi:Leucine-rich repeat (LRR) protein
LELLELYDNMIDELRELDVRRADADGVAAVVGEVVGEGEEDGDVAKSSEEAIELLPRTELKVLDISYNVIRDMGPISLCPNLQELCECLISCSDLCEIGLFPTQPLLIVHPQNDAFSR